MNNYISFTRLTVSDAEHVLLLLKQESPDYLKYFSPFPLEFDSIKECLEGARKDVFLGIELMTESNRRLIGFYMLRGIDEGYQEPMYGVFIARCYSGQGIGRLTLSHAESFCRLNGYSKLLLKVHPENIRAKGLYESVGFQFLRQETSINNLVLCKRIGISEELS